MNGEQEMPDRLAQGDDGPPPSHLADAVAYAVQVEQYIDKLRADGVIADLGLLDDRPAHEVPANIDEVIAETENTQTENDLLKQRVAELEAAVTSIGGALQNAETALAQLEADEDRDDCRMVLHRARCAVEHERKLAATQDRWDRIGEIRMACAHYGPALEEASECVRIQTERVAELEAENERLRAALMPLETSSIASAVQEAAAATMQRDELQAVLEQERDKSDAARRWAAVWKRAASKFRAWQADTEAALEQERRAVGVLGEELETRFGICACDVQDGWEQHRGGSVVGACWAEWAQQQAQARAEGGEPDEH